ncbi:MAG: MFS transporter [Clostridia bacterium]|nr:MFS transporter [Clostridia bacterium]
MEDNSAKARVPLSEKVRGSGLYRVYNPKDEHGRGRLCMLLSGVFGGLAGQFSGDIFYTAFLLSYGFKYSDISILLLVPYITTFLHIFSPAILERFKRRKVILAVARLATHTINILGITLLPLFFAKDADGKIINTAGMTIAFVALIITANAISALFSPGYSAWHANFLTDNVRADYFTSSQCINATVYVAVFFMSIFADDLEKTNPSAYAPFLTGMRYLAYVLAVIDVIFLLIPKEYEYSKTVEKPNVKDIFTLPFKNKPFLLTIIIVVLVTFATNIHAGYINAFIMNDIGVPKRLISGINALYFLFFIMFGAMWKKFIAKKTWFRALGFSLIIEALSYLLYSFITPGNLVLYTIVRLWQHVMGVVRGTIIATMPYINLPDSDRTNYLAFYTIVNNLGAFISRLVGQAIYENIGHAGFIIDAFSAIGIHGEVPILILLCAVLESVVAIPCFLWFRKITPKPLLDEYDARRAMKKQLSDEKKAQKAAGKAEKM